MNAEEGIAKWIAEASAGRGGAAFAVYYSFDRHEWRVTSGHHEGFGITLSEALAACARAIKAASVVPPDPEGIEL